MFEPNVRDARVYEPNVSDSRVYEPDVSVSGVYEPDMRDSRVCEPQIRARLDTQVHRGSMHPPPSLSRSFPMTLSL